MSKKEIKMGWKCPECGTVYAPHVNECTRLHLPTNKYVAPVWPYPYTTPYPYRPWVQWTVGDSTVATDTIKLSDRVVGSDTIRIGG